MIRTLFAVSIILLILVVAEYARHRKWLKGETNRKFVHIVTGTFVATWPFFMSLRLVQVLSLALLLVITFSRQLNLFRSIHSVDRRGAGEILFALGIGLTALMSVNKWVFAAAILHMSLADGLAGLVGARVHLRGHYTVFGEKRTVQGTLTFLLLSVAILSWVVFIAPAGLHSAASVVLWLPILATIVENVSILGLDNVSVPVLVAVVLGLLS